MIIILLTYWAWNGGVIYKYNIQPGQHSSTVFAGSLTGPPDIIEGGPGVGGLKVPTSIEIDSSDSTLYVGSGASPGTIVKIDIATQYITHIAGNETSAGHADNSSPLNATFKNIMAIALSPDDSYLAIVSWGNYKIRN